MSSQAFVLGKEFHGSSPVLGSALSEFFSSRVLVCELVMESPESEELLVCERGWDKSSDDADKMLASAADEIEFGSCVTGAANDREGVGCFASHGNICRGLPANVGACFGTSYHIFPGGLG